MLGLSRLHERLAAVEQLIHRNNKLLGSMPLSSGSKLNEAPSSNTSSTQPIAQQINDITISFHALMQQHTTIQSYVANLPALQSLLDTHSPSSLSSSSFGSSSSRQRQEEEFVLSASQSGLFERTALLCGELEACSSILDEPWPELGNLSSLDRRCDALEGAIKPAAFQAAQIEVAFENFLNNYTQCIDLCNQQFVAWMQHVEKMEKEIDRIAEKKGTK